MAGFEMLSPPYSTIVADPPWDLASINSGWATTSVASLPYSTLTLDEIADLPVSTLADRKGAHLYLWTVTSVLRHSFGIVEAWGFSPKQVLVWTKPGLGPGARFRQTCEYVIFGSRGPSLPITRRDIGTWFQWPRNGHSVKPAAFGDLVESVSPGPYVELFARSPRLGWDSWGYGYECSNTAIGSVTAAGSDAPHRSHPSGGGSSVGAGRDARTEAAVRLPPASPGIPPL